MLTIRADTAYSSVEADDVERKLQAWLNDNHNARIEHVALTPIVSGAVGGSSKPRLLVTIFYRD